MYFLFVERLCYEHLTPVTSIQIRLSEEMKIKAKQVEVLKQQALIKGEEEEKKQFLKLSDREKVIGCFSLNITLTF